MIAALTIKQHLAPMASRLEILLPQQMQVEMRPERIGHRLKLLRMSQGLSPAEIADMLDIERTYWSRFEGGKRPITESIAALLVDRFGVTLDFIILGRWDKLPFDVAQQMLAAEESLKNN